MTLFDCPKTDLKPIPLKPVFVVSDFLVPLFTLHKPFTSLELNSFPVCARTN